MTSIYSVFSLLNIFCMIIDGEYTYQVIDTQSDARLCAQLIADEFAAHNSIALLDNLTPRRFFDEVAWPVFSELVDERLSFLARHRSSGEIIGGIAAGDLYLAQTKHSYDATLPAQDSGFKDLLDELGDRFVSRDFGQELKPNLVLQINVAAVKTEYTGKGIASRLSMYMCNHARDTKGFEYALVQVTNPATEHLYLNKMGGKIVSTIDPTTWRWKKKDDGLSCPYKEYKHGLIPNILIKLGSDQEK